ncbi:MAG: hypothetical protein K6E62_04470 [Lachnospiraceae bacterium]|nr:hypothetical protein [Lachnospiraceae bacterium]
MIIKLLEIRTFLIKVYQKGRFIINPLIRFLVAFLVFKGINASIGYDTRFTGNTVTLLLSAVCAVLPSGMIVFLAMLLSLIHVFKVSIFVAPLLLIVYIILYAMLMRFSPKQAVVSVLIPLLAGKNLHYCVPMVLGCIATPLSALPCACGLVIYYMLDIVKAAAARQIQQLNLDDVLQLYLDIVDATMANKQMFVAIAVFTLVVIVVWLIRQFSFEYALVISIGAGVITNILGFLIADFKYSSTVNVGTLILMSLLAGFIALIGEYFKRVLDYTAIERVQFEDDDYYYYVKAVPKVNLSMPRHNVQRIVENEGESDEDDEEYSDISIVGNDDVRYEDYTEEDYNVDTDTSDSDDDDDSRRFPGFSSRFDRKEKSEKSRIKGRYAFKHSSYGIKTDSETDDSDPGLGDTPNDEDPSAFGLELIDQDEDGFKDSEGTDGSEAFGDGPDTSDASGTSDTTDASDNPDTSDTSDEVKYVDFDDEDFE